MWFRALFLSSAPRKIGAGAGTGPGRTKHEGYLAVPRDALCEWAESAEVRADYVLPARLQSNKSAE